MKRKKTTSGLLLILMLTIVSVSHSRIINVSVSNNVFTPSTINNAFVGDTIKWTRTAGSHTTTCDGQAFTSRPAGAAPWNTPLNSGNPTFSYVIQVAGTYNYICEPHSPDMAGVIVAAISSITQTNETATGFKLSQNYPNPFNPSTKIKFSVPQNSRVSLKIFDINGREVESLVNEELNPSSYEAEWDASKLSSGVYYYRLDVSGLKSEFSETKKMLLIK